MGMPSPGRRWSALPMVVAMVIVTTLSWSSSASATAGHQPRVSTERVDGETAVYFHNQYRNTVYVAIAEWSPDTCAYYGKYMVSGWWPVEMGATVHVLNTSGRYFAYYAESHDGHTWSGDGTYSTWVQNPGPFHNCWTADQDSGWRRVNFSNVDAGGNASYTINITP